MREEKSVPSLLPVKLTEDAEEGMEGKRTRGRVEKRSIPDLSKSFSIRCLKMAQRKMSWKDFVETLSGYQHEDEGSMEEKDKKVIICCEIKCVYHQNFLRIHIKSAHRTNGVRMQKRWCLLDILSRTDGIA